MFHTSTRSLGRTIAALTLLCLGFTAAPASATGGGGDPEPCVPKDAWTETIEHPAETHVVQHPAETHVVHHEAVTHPEYRYERSVPKFKTKFQYQKQTQTTTKHGQHGGTTVSGWTSWSPVSVRWSFSDVAVLEGPAPHGSGSNPHDGHTDQWTRVYQYVKNGESQQVPDGSTVETTDWLAAPPAGDGWVQIDEREFVDEEAYDETVVDTEAYEETVVDREAWTETIEHPAVTCTPEFTEYEVCVLWSVDNPGVSDFPQTRVDTDDCTVPPATCEGDQRFQRDYYWIRDADDEQYLAGLKHLNSPADDARLEPHNWSMIDVPARTGEDCAPPTTEVTPTAPTGTPDDCDPDPFGTITIPSQDGVLYKVNGVVTPAGTIPANGTNTVTAEAASDDVTLVGTTSWEFTSNPETDCPVPPVDVCVDIPGDQAEVPPGHVYDGETGECVLIPEEPVLPPNKPEKPTKPAKPSAGPPTVKLTQAPAQPAQPAQQAAAVLPATGAPASLWFVLLGAGLVLGGVVLTRRSKA